MKYHLPFGTHGIRGAASAAPFTRNHLHALGRALQIFLTQQNMPQTFLVGSDTRESCAQIKQGLFSGFLPHTIVQDAGVIPTPVLSMLLTKKPEFGCGIMITASHNPAHDNGIKIVLQHGAELTKADEHILQELFDANFSDHLIEAVPQCIIKPYKSAFPEYLNHIKGHFTPRFLAGLSIGLDCANGSTSAYAPAIFEYFGATVHAIHNKPTGSNINQSCGSTHPEQLQSFVQKNNLEIGFAFDGDGDRVVAINASGILKDGDDLLVLLASNLPAHIQHTVVSTKLSNSALKQALNLQGATLITSDVGEHAVVEQMKKHNAPLGAEPSGHIVIKKHLISSDGIFAALCIMQAALDKNNLFLETFTHNPHVLKSISVTHKPSLAIEPLASIIEMFSHNNPGVFHVIRYSGTESVLRIYIEAETLASATMCAENLAMQLVAEINDTLNLSPNAQQNQRSA